MAARTSWLVLSLIFFVADTTAQHLSFECLTEQNNNFQGTHFNLMQAGTGSLWLGTSTGGWVYDGVNTKPLILDLLPGEPAISTIAEDRSGRLWLGFASGQIAQADALGNFVPWEIEEGWPQARITAIREDESGQLWFGTYGEGVYCYRNGRLYQFGKDDGLKSEDIYDLILDPSGMVWAATDAGICLMRWKNNEKWIRNFSTEDGLPDNIVTSLFSDSIQACWIGTYDSGIAYCEYKDGKLRVAKPDTWPGGTVSSLAKLDEDQLWVGTADQGIHVFSLAANEINRVPIGIANPPQRIISLLFDQEGLLWVLSHEQGLCKVQPRLMIWEGLEIAPQALVIDQQNTLWVGSSDGLYYQQGTGTKLLEYELDMAPNIISLYVDENNRLWLGTFGEGLYILDVQQGRIWPVGAKEGLGNGSILSIAGNEEGVWLATLGGVYFATLPILPFSEVPPFTKPVATKAIGTDFLYCNYVDQNGNVWFGTDGYGVSCLQINGSLKTFRTSVDSMAISAVYAIAQDGLGRIWISANDQRLFFYENGVFQRANVPLSFGRNEVISLGNDNQGNILITHQRGVAVLDVQSGEIIDYHHLSEKVVFTPALNAIDTDNDGKVWLGGLDQLITYIPLKGRYRQQPKLSLESVSIYLTPFDFRNKKTLKASENNLIFRFNGVWLSDPEEVRFQYQLKGFDQNWIATRDHQAVYSNLPPGNYEFIVTAAQNNNFHPDQDRVVYAFQIRPPFYLQLWFIAFAILSIALLIRFLLRRREDRLQKEALLLSDKVRSQYETLKSQINPHFLFNSFNTLVALIEEQPRSAVTYVEKLSDFYRSILQYREQDAIDLAEEMQVVKDYHFLLTRRYQDNLQLHIFDLPVDVSVPPLVVQMLLENAVKHNVISSRYPLQINIYGEGGYLIVENKIQPKLTKQPSTGFGLQNIRNRYALISSQPVKIEEKDAIFRVALPLIPLDRLESAI